MENLDKFGKSIDQLSEVLVDADVRALEATAPETAYLEVRPALELIRKKVELISSVLRDKQKVIENITEHELNELKDAVDGLGYTIAQKEGGFTRFISNLITASRPFMLMKS